jgi:hypothetical protein
MSLVLMDLLDTRFPLVGSESDPVSVGAGGLSEKDIVAQLVGQAALRNSAHFLLSLGFFKGLGVGVKIALGDVVYRCWVCPDVGVPWGLVLLSPGPKVAAS